MGLIRKAMSVSTLGIRWDDLPTVTKLQMPVGLVIRCASATTARNAGRHRGVRRRNPGLSRARSTKGK